MIIKEKDTARYVLGVAGVCSAASAWLTVYHYFPTVGTVILVGVIAYLIGNAVHILSRKD